MDRDVLVYAGLAVLPIWWGGCGRARARSGKALPSNTTRAGSRIPNDSPGACAQTRARAVSHHRR